MDAEPLSPGAAGKDPSPNPASRATLPCKARACVGVRAVVGWSCWGWTPTTHRRVPWLLLPFVAPLASLSAHVASSACGLASFCAPVRWSAASQVAPPLSLPRVPVGRGVRCRLRCGSLRVRGAALPGFRPDPMRPAQPDHSHGALAQRLTTW